MGYALSGGQGWNAGYRTVALMQMVLTAVLFLSLPLWKRRAAGEPEAARQAPVPGPRSSASPGPRK